MAKPDIAQPEERLRQIRALEMRTAANLLFDRLPNLRLDPGDSDPHIRGQVFRSPTTLPVRFDV